jgi:hypothetical protein
MQNNFDMIYEEPGSLFDVEAWSTFRDQMLKEQAKHPDWKEPKEALRLAEIHLDWIKMNSPVKKAA